MSSQPHDLSQPDNSILASLLPHISNYNLLLRRVNELATNLFPADAGFTARVEPGEKPRLHIAARSGIDIDGDGLPDLILCSDLIDPWELAEAPVVIDDLAVSTRKLASFLTKGKLRSLMAIPLPGSAGDVSAVLVLGSRTAGAFARLNPAELQSFRDAVVLPLSVAAEFNRQENLTETALQLSHTLWQTIRQENGYRDVLRVLLDKALEFSGAAAGSLMVVGSETNELYVRAARGISTDNISDDQLPWGTRSAQPLWAAGTTIRCLDLSSSPAPGQRAFAAKNGFASYCGLALHFDDHPANGMINLYWREQVGELPRQTHRLLEILTHAGAEILEYSRMYEALKTDELVRKQFNEHKGILVSLIAHQLRTPLTSIKGFSQLMVRRANNGQPIGDVRHAQTLLTESNRLSVMIENLLDLSRLERTMLEIERQPFDMAAFTTELRNDTFVAQLIESGTLTWIIPSRLPNPVGDALRLRQAVLALIRRARTRSEVGAGLTIELRVQNNKDKADPGLSVEFVVSGGEQAGDLGDGDPLAMIDLRNVVEQQSATQDELALYTAVLLVRSMGGDLRVRAALNDKLNYVVSLPAAESGT